MKVGAENRKVLISALVLGVLALALAVRMIMVVSVSPKAPPPNPAQQGKQAPVARGAAPARLPALNTLDPTLRLDILRASEATDYKGSGRNIFAFKERVIEQPRVPVVAQGPKCPGDPRCPPPPPPPIPLTFYGFSSRPGEPKKVFLKSNDGDVFTAAEGEVVNRRYRVLRIGVNSVEIEDVLSNNRQTIPLTQG